MSPMGVLGFTHRRSSSSPEPRMRMRKLISYTRMSNTGFYIIAMRVGGVIEGNNAYVICSPIMQFVIKSFFK